VAGSVRRGCGSTRWITGQIGLTLIQNSREHESVEVKVHPWLASRDKARSSLTDFLQLCLATPHLATSHPLEILSLAKLRALCLHSRFINPLIPPTRSFHVLPPSVRTKNLENMNWSTSVYTTLSSDTEPSIVITFDSAKYIFNAGENTTRAILQDKRGWRRVKALFLTQLGTQRSSGVPGELLNSSLSVVHSPGCL
jgi:hypothetical protein